LLKANEAQIEAAGGLEGRGQICNLILQATWFTLLKEDEGQIEASGG
jgi:hypothetical protein